MFVRIFFFLFVSSWVLSSQGEVVSYEFDVGTKQVNVAGELVAALAINDQIPAPAIRATVGDILQVTFHNHLNVSTSVHWHGILLPGSQDGVPFINTQPIQPGSSHMFEFPIRHAGTFWYHSHSDLQIQGGVYGPLVLSEQDAEVAMQEELVVFSDWTNEGADRVLANLKKDDDYYSFKRDKVQSWDRVLVNGPEAIRNRLNQSFTRMGPMDLADVGYDAFLVNGQQANFLELSDSEAGQVKLRMINGSTSSYFDVEYAGGPMTIVAADGQDVVPIRAQRLRMSTAETYDVLVPTSPGQSFELRATSFDGTGHSSLFVGEGERVAAPDIAPPNPYLMEHSAMEMDMDMGEEMGKEMGKEMDRTMNKEITVTQNHDHSAQAMGSMQPMTDVIEHMLDYENLVALKPTTLPANQEWRDIELTLSGNMERYVWSFNGKTAREETQIFIQKGENVRFHLSNSTMMHHPLHLHGHFFRVVNQHGERSPLKHTVNVPPMGHVMIEFNASDSADWLFHCHNQYHMKTGMNRVISYQNSSLYTEEIGNLIQPNKRWFTRGELFNSTNFVDLEFSLLDDRHEFDLEIDADFSDTYEVHALYNYHFNRFASAFVGIESREHHHAANHLKNIAGINLTLPFLIESEWRMDDHGDFRLELESELQFTRRFSFDWRWNTDDEHRYGLKYNISRRWSMMLSTDSEYGEGLGINYLF